MKNEKKVFRSIAFVMLIQSSILFAIFEKCDCNQIVVENKYEDERIEQIIASCVAVCLQNVTLSHLANLDTCFSDCDNSTFDFSNSLLLEKIEVSAPELVCRDTNKIVLDLLPKSESNPLISVNIGSALNEKQKLLFLVNIEKMYDSNLISYVTDTSILLIENLETNSTYNITVVGFDGEHRYNFNNLIATTMHDEYRPEVISRENIAVLTFELNSERNGVNAEIHWQRANDLTCDYDMQIFSMKDDSDHFLVEHIHHPESLDHHLVQNLYFNTDYSIGVRGINKQNHYNYYDELIFETPACWDFDDFDPDACAPAPLSNIRATHSHVGNFTFNVNVTWEEPHFLPDFYNIRIIDMVHSLEEDDQINQYNGTFAGNITHAYFPQVILRGMQFAVVIEIQSKGGVRTESSYHSLNQTYEEVLRQSRESSVLPRTDFPLLAVCILILVLVILVLVILFSCWHFGTKNRRVTCPIPEMQIRQLAESFNNDKMEIEPGLVHLDGVLGEGAFGVVHKGLLFPQNEYVAVKMLKDGASSDNVTAFFQEINLMKSVDKHENIVGIVGHSTSDCSRIMLLTEYCSEGNLLDYLRSSRPLSGEHISNLAINRLYGVQAERRYYNESRILIENPTYEINLKTISDTEDIQKKRIDLSSQDLLKFARQIACGMEFLAKNKIIHRDLAARNVLVCADKTLKIADFGLSRDIYEDNIYVKSTVSRLPLKWLALESIVHNYYTTSSDIWSYGILLYEIATLGATPYPTISVHCLVNHLKDGNRMEKPVNCSEKFYNLMLSCWKSQPEERPTFTECIDKLDDFLANVAPEQIITIS